MMEQILSFLVALMVLAAFLIHGNGIKVYLHGLK